MRKPNSLLKSMVIAVAMALCLAAIYLSRHSLYFFVVVFLAGLLLAIATAVLFAGKVRDLAVMTATVCLVLIGIESIALFNETSPRASNEGRYTQDYIGFDRVLGAAPAKAGSFDTRKIDQRSGSVIYDVSYTIDEHLIRATQSSDSGPVIAFFGDSFMFGEGVSDSETLPQDFADLMDRRLRVLNFGFHGYGPQQFLRTLETGHFDGLMRPGLGLVVFQTAPWHAERTSCAADFVAGSPRYELRGGAAEFSGACGGTVRNVVFKQFEKSAAYRWLIQPIIAGSPDRDDMELYLAVVSRAVQEANSRYGVPTVILYLSYNDRYLQRSGFTNEEIMERFHAAGAHVVDVTLTHEDGSPLTSYDQPTPLIIQGDGHPTALAQRKRAELLVDYLALHLPQALAALGP